jgi:spermidine synthase
MPRASVRLENGRKVLRVGGVIQSVGVDVSHVPDVWDAMLPRARPQSALILGLGGGTIAALMTCRWGPLPIVGVERDPAVAWLARHEFGLDALPHVEIVVADAFEYARRCERRFDAVCVDLYVAGKLAHGVLGAAFLRDVARLLTPCGVAAFNLWRSSALAGAVRRIGRELLTLDTIDVDDNVILRCARRPYDRTSAKAT